MQPRNPTQDQYQINVQELIDKVDKYEWSDTLQTQFPKSVYPIQPPQNRKKYYKYLRYALQKQQNSERVFALTSLMLYFNMNNYYALMLRKDSQPKNGFNIIRQIHFINCLLDMNSKQYQLWNYKKQLISQHYSDIQKQSTSQTTLINQQYKFMQHILTQEDSKNYHVWDYRTWITRHFRVFDRQLELTKNLLYTKQWQQIKQTLPEGAKIQNVWLLCNSVWSYRFYLYKDYCADQHKKTVMINQQIERVIEFIKQNRDNQSAWNYISGIYSDLLVDEEQKIKIYELSKSIDNRFSLNFQLMNSPQNNTKQILQKLKTIDPTRQLYYKYLQNNDL